MPFDAQGFMAYRLAMMQFAGAAFLAVYGLTQSLADRCTARFAILIAATTPFLVHEVWFTWPKLAAAAFVVLAFGQLLAKRPFVSGLFVGIGYLVHPLALLSVPVLALVAMWPLLGARLSRPRVVNLVRLAVGTGVFVLGWRLLNQHHFAQGGFFNYVTQANRVASR